MKTYLFAVLVVIASVSLVGCGSIYSPTLNLPHAPLEKNQGQLTGAASGLPQIGTDNVGITFSGEGQVAYGFSDRVALHGKLWSQVSEVWQGKFNGGTSLGADFLLNEREDKIPFVLIPNVSMLVSDNTINAFGATVQLAAWFPEWGLIRPYAAAGPGLLSKRFQDNDWGYALLLNAGVSVKMSPNVRANIELFGAAQRYMQNAKIETYVGPSVSLSWAFDNR